jgi:DNA-binding transcriptional regulator GbsR (MarR family)
MEKDKLSYIEEFGLYFEKLGLTRMSGRIFGYLIVNGKENNAFEEFQQVLQASKGSISGTLKMLVNTGFVQPVSLPGDRKTYYRVSQQEIARMMDAKILEFIAFSKILEKGLQLRQANDDVSDWIRQTSAFYQWASNEVDAIVKKWERDKVEIMKRYYPES